jgi:hypothetical protein
MSGNDAVTVVYSDLSDSLWAAFAESFLVAWDIETSGLDWREDQIGTCQLFAEGIGTVVVSVHGAQVPGRAPARSALIPVWFGVRAIGRSRVVGRCGHAT